MAQVNLFKQAFLIEKIFLPQYLYEVMVFTGGTEEAATKSKVQFILTGEDDETDVRTFQDSSR